MKILRSILLPMIMMMCVYSDAQTTYYVSKSGDDSNTGLSLNQSWLTVQHAMDHATAHSTVYITAGTYQENVEVNVSGTPSGQIVFRPYEDDIVILTDADTPDRTAILGIFNQDYITIQGLYIRDNERLDAQGIIVFGSCTGIQLIENDISNINYSNDPNLPATASRNSQPLIVYGTDGTQAVSQLEISRNIIHHSRTGYSEGLAVNGNIDGFVIRDNIVHDITNIGIDIIGHEGEAPQNDQARNGIVERNEVYQCKSPYATAAGIYVDGARDIIIRQNKVYDNQWGIEIGCENIGKSSNNIIVESNWIYDNDDACIAMGGFDYPSGSGKVTNSRFVNNTCYNNDKTSALPGDVTGEIHISYTELCTLANNIYYTENPEDIMLYLYSDTPSSGWLSDHNIYYSSGPVDYEYQGAYYSSLSSYQSGTFQDAHSIFANPGFSNATSGDLHISDMSVAQDSGAPGYHSSAIDIDGQERVIYSGIDIGADEHVDHEEHIYLEQMGITVRYNPYPDQAILIGDLDDYTIELRDVSGALLTDYSSSSTPLIIPVGLYDEPQLYIYLQHTIDPDLSVELQLK